MGVNRRDPGNDFNTVGARQDLASYRTRRNPRSGFTCTRSPTSAPIPDPILGVIGVVGVTRPVLQLHLTVVTAALIFVRDQQADRSTQGLSLEHTRQDLHRVRFLPLGHQMRLPRCTTVKVGLDIRLVKRNERRTAIDDRTNRPSVRLPPRRDTEDRAKAIAHLDLSRRFPRPDRAVSEASKKSRWSVVGVQLPLTG